MAEPKWRKFEKDIQRIFEGNSKAKVQRDVVIKGRSGRDRKLELYVEYPFEIPFAEGFTAQVPIQIAVDCKDYEKKVGIKKVEEFAGQMDDVGAPIGIMVAPKGFDAGAEARAKQLNVYLINAPWDLLSLAKGIGEPPRFHECSACSEARDEESFGGIVDWFIPTSKYNPVWGNCDWCDAPHVMCPDCGEITGFAEVDYDEWIECAGGCMRVYKVWYDVHSAGYDSETISGIQRQILVEIGRTGTLGIDRVQKILSKTKWQYANDSKNDPIQEMQKNGWIIKRKKDLQLQEHVLGLVQDELPNARDAYYW